MNAHEAGHGDLVKRAKERKKAIQEKRDAHNREIVGKALGNGMRITYSSDPVKGEVKLAKFIRKEVGK